MNYPNRNILYYPDVFGGEGGGRDVEGGEGGRDYEGSGEAGIDFETLPLQQQISLIKKVIQELRRQKKKRPIKSPPCADCPPEVIEEDLEIEKLEFALSLLKKRKITLFKIKKGFIPPKGDKRKITIKGDPSSVFSLTIKDSSDCSILKEEIENEKIPENGIYEFTQEFPSIMTEEGASRTAQTYTLTLTPPADVVTEVNETITLDQYADPIITVTNSFTAKTIGGNIQVAGSDIIKTGPAFTRTQDIPGYSSSTYTLTITESSAVDGFFYVKNTSFDNNITTNTTIKKVFNKGDETNPTTSLTLKPLTTRTDTTIEGSDSITGDLISGMRLYAKLEKTKKLKASLDKDDNILDYGKCNTPTDKIELLDTNDLVEDMIVSGDGIIETIIKSIDCDKKIITLSKKHIIKKDTELTFTKEWRSSIVNIVSQSNSDGNACIDIGRPLDIPNDTEISFDDNASILRGSFGYTGSGSSNKTVVLTMSLNTVSYGSKNVTYTLDLDNIITRKPNAYDQQASIKKNSSGYAIKMLRGDNDANASSGKTGTEVRPAAHGTVGSYDGETDTFTYTPNNGFIGEDSFTFTMSDGTTASEEKTVRITVK